MTHHPCDAVVFDLDGVLTSTTALHAVAWGQTVAELLAEPFGGIHVASCGGSACSRDPGS